MSGPERVWYLRLCRRLGANCGPPLDAAGVHVAHELLRALASPDRDVGTIERLSGELDAAHVRSEDECAERLGMPPRP